MGHLLWLVICLFAFHFPFNSCILASKNGYQPCARERETFLTLEASPLNNRWYEHSEHPWMQTPPSTARTPTGCPTYNSDVSFVILHTKFIQQSFKLIASRDAGMMCLLVDDVLSHPFFVSIGVGQSTIPTLPTFESWKALRRSLHQIIGCNLQVMDESRNGNRRVQRDKNMNMVGHTIYPIELAIVLLAEAIDIGIEVTLMCLNNRCRALMGTKDNMIDELGVRHSIYWMIGDPSRVGVTGVSAIRRCSLRSYLRLLSGDRVAVLNHSQRKELTVA